MTARTYGVTQVRGPFVQVPPHPQSFGSDEERDFLVWAKSVAKPKAMDLFCGAGGLSLGLSQSGFEVILGVDNDREALETHRSIAPGLSVDWDLASNEAIERVIRIGNAAGVELVAGGPPCQPFSKAGRSMIRDLVRTGRRKDQDDRRDLWESFMTVVEGLRPKAVLMENVPDMALDRDMQILRTMVELLEVLNYSVSVRVVDSSRYEVPQFRQRLILVALQNNTNFVWPEESAYQVTLRTAIGDLPPVEGGWRPAGGAEGWADYTGPYSAFQTRARESVDARFATQVFDHITRPVREDDKVIFSAMNSETSYSEIDEAVAALDRVSEDSGTSREGTLKRYRDDIFDDKYKRLDWNQVSRTITAHIAKDGYWYIHPDQDRTLTIREAARIQTFPDHIRFSGPPSAAFRQIGNAVPPRLGEYLGTAIQQSLNARTTAGPTTIQTAKRLSDWFEGGARAGTLRFPWLHQGGANLLHARWRVLQAEILLGRSRSESANALWPLLSRFNTPQSTLENAEEVVEMAGWIDRQSHAHRLLEAATWFATNPNSLETVDGMRSAPHVTEAFADLAARVAPGPDEDPVVATAGLLRVAARHSGSSVDRRNSRSDGRIAIARLIGADDERSDHAFLGLIELAETLCTSKQPLCIECPLRASCTERLNAQAPSRSATSG